MRVLDVGAHDGYVTSWLLQRFDGCEIDGVELNPHAVAEARRRGINCVQGAAEDAPRLFEPGSYDAVVCFELIEHVPDVDELLAALEQMVKPDGRIYVSTPDGTFGEGNNPHHLRCYRAIDLADELRRRGRLADMMVGFDGVTVASYTPAARKGDVAIFTGPSWCTWSPMDILREGLGGSETAATRLAEELSQLGYIVTVYGDVEQTCVRDVIYKHWSTFDPLEPREALISSRIPDVFDRPVAARCRLLWMHDTDCQDRLTEPRADRIDWVLTLSGWHRGHVEGLYPFLRDREPRSKVLQTRNGIHHKLFAGPQPERRRRVLYTSSPDRGLDVLLELWPRIRERVPDAELAYAYSPVYFRVAAQDPTVGAHHARIRELADQPGVVDLGSLSQPQLAQVMRESLVWTAPSWNTPHDMPFHETSCIGAMEAQAAGLHVVASNWGALPETVKVGRLVNSDPPGPRWRKAIVDHIVEGLEDPDVQAYAQVEGPKAVAALGWGGVAGDVVALIDGEVPDA